MSKYLLKILSICAFVILLPLIVVGSALCVTEAMGCSLTITYGGENGRATGTKTSISIGIDDEIVIDNGETKTASGYIDLDSRPGYIKLTLKKNSDVTVTYNESECEGVDFVGWYKGYYDQIKPNAKAVSTKTSYPIIVRGNTVLTAVRNAKKYNVTYAGVMNDGTTNVVDSLVGPITAELYYNEPLETIHPILAEGQTEDDVAWSGWYITGSDDTTGTKVANFKESGTYTLNPVWSDLMFITYYAKDGSVITTDSTFRDGVATYTLLSGTNDQVVSKLTRGYSFAGWTYNSEDITSIPEYKSEGYKLYIRETLNTYNFTVKYHAVSEVTDELTYDVENGYSAYKTRNGYKLQGFVYNNNLYTFDATLNDYVYSGEKLSDVLLTNSNVSVTAKWESIYTPFDIAIDARASYVREGYEELGNKLWGVVGDVENVSTPLEKGTVASDGGPININFVDEDDENSFDLEESLYAYLTNGYTNLRTVFNVVEEGKETAQRPVEWKGRLQVEIDGGDTINIDMRKTDMTFEELLRMTVLFDDGSVLAYDRLDVHFVFEVVA